MADLVVPGHLVFVGMMGSGKTTVGKRVANRIGRPFFDSDEEIEERTGCSVLDWFTKRSEHEFRDAESEVLKVLLATTEPAVIATGGGVVIRPENRAMLRSSDVTVVWLRAKPKFLAARVSQKPNKDNRPLLATDTDATMIRLDEERRGHYAEVADLIIDVEPIHRTEQKPKKKLATLVIEALSGEDADRSSANIEASS